MMETITGAFLAALISFLTVITALFFNDSELTFAMIKQATWVSMIGGAGIQFLKDYQARAFRRVVATMRGQPNELL
jgi:hypothetical protein